MRRSPRRPVLDRPRLVHALMALGIAALVGAVPGPGPGATAATGQVAAAAPPRIVPAPATLETVPGASYELTRDTRITVMSPKATAVAAALAGTLRRATGYPLPVTAGDDRGDISLSLSGPHSLGQ